MSRQPVVLWRFFFIWLYGNRLDGGSWVTASFTAVGCTAVCCTALCWTAVGWTAVVWTAVFWTVIGWTAVGWMASSLTSSYSTASGMKVNFSKETVVTGLGTKESGCNMVCVTAIFSKSTGFTVELNTKRNYMGSDSTQECAIPDFPTPFGVRSVFKSGKGPYLTSMVRLGKVLWHKI